MRLILIAILLLPCLFANAQSSEEYSRLFGEIGTPTIETTGRMIRLRDGNLLMCGQWHDGLPFLQKTDPAGRVIFRKPYYLPGNNGQLTDVVEMPDGNLAATGGCLDCMPGDNGYAMLSIYTDPHGNLIQIKKHGLPGVDDFAYGIDTLPGGGLVVVGKQPPFATMYIYDQWLNPRDSAIFRMNGGTEELAYDVVTASDGNLFVTGRTTIGFAPYLLLRKFTSTGTEIWSKRLYEDLNTGQVRGQEIRESGNGTLLVCGTRYNNSALGADIFLTEFSADTGAVITERLFGSTSLDQGYAMDLSDEYILLAGMHRHEIGLGNLWRSSVYRLDTGLNLIDSTVYDRPLMRDQATGVAFIDELGKDFAYCGISYSNNYAYQDIYWGRHFQRGKNLVLEEFPRTLQLYPRDLSTNHGQVKVRAYLTDSTLPYQIVRLHVFRDGQPFSVQGQLLEFIDDTARIAINFNLPAELAEYDFELSVSTGFVNISEAIAVNVVAGDAFLVTGQSNAVSKQRDTVAAEGSPWIRTYGSGNPSGFPDGWFVGEPNADMGNDGNIGQLSATLGREIVNNQQIPVAIINGGHNGAAIYTFTPVPAQPLMATNYGRTFLRATNSGLATGIRAVVFWQGETDAFYGTSTAYYAYHLDSIRRSWQRDFPAIEQMYMFQIRNGCSSGYNGLVRTLGGQFTYADNDPAVHLLSTTGLDHLQDVCHFTYHNGYKKAGLQLYQRLRPHLYGGPIPANTTPPSPDSAWFPDCHKDTIRLALRNTTDSYTVDSNIGADFILSDPGVNVTSASISGHVLTLVLDDTLTGNASFSYFSHMGAPAPALLNANGIGLLSFADLPIACKAAKPPVIRKPIDPIRVSVRAQIIRMGNPAAIEIEADQTQVNRLRLTDMYGKIVWRGDRGQVRNNRIILPGLAQGIYLLQIEYSNGTAEVRKLLAQ
jgi:hypothetical protein